MLVLARRTNEAIKIGPNITVTVLRVKGKALKLGIEAPGNMLVVRAELMGRSGEPRRDADAPPPAPEDGCAGQGSPANTRPGPALSGATSRRDCLQTGYVAPRAGRRGPRLARRVRAVLAAR